MRNNCDNHDDDDDDDDDLPRSALSTDNGDDDDDDRDMRLRTLCAFLSSLLFSQEVVDFSQRSQLIARYIEIYKYSLPSLIEGRQGSFDRFLMPIAGQTKAELKLCKLNWLN